MVVVAVALSFPFTGSTDALVTVAVLLITVRVPESAVTASFTVEVVPLAIELIAQLTPPASPLAGPTQETPVGAVMPAKPVPTGTTALSVMPDAAPGPAFFTVMV